jgi:hypothetical protein
LHTRVAGDRSGGGQFDFYKAGKAAWCAVQFADLAAAGACADALEGACAWQRHLALASASDASCNTALREAS